MLPCVCSVIDHRGRQNVVTTKMCANHTKRVGDKKKILQLKTFAEVLLTGFYPFKNIQAFLVSSRHVIHVSVL